MGLGSSIYDGTILGRLLGFTTRIINPEIIVDKVTGREKFFDYSPFDDRTRSVITNSKIPVGVFIDKDLKEVNKIFVPFFQDRKSTRLNSSHVRISYAVFCLK